MSIKVKGSSLYINLNLFTMDRITKINPVREKAAHSLLNIKYERYIKKKMGIKFMKISMVPLK